MSRFQGKPAGRLFLLASSFYFEIRPLSETKQEQAFALWLSEACKLHL
jgi:hypothetical protein